MVEEGKSAVSAPLILTVEFLVALILAACLLYKYGDIRRQNPFVTAFTLVVWFLSFVIIFLLPVDVSSVSGTVVALVTLHWYSLVWEIFLSM